MASVLKPNQVDSSFLKDIETKYGSIDMENDFFSADLSKYFKTTEYNEKTNSVEHEIIPLISFKEIFLKYVELLVLLKKLKNDSLSQKDTKFINLYEETKKVFNSFRTHIRKNYPSQYEELKSSLNEMSTTGGGAFMTSGNGEQYSTPKAFKQIKKTLKENNTYKYKLGKTKNPAKEFQQERLDNYDKINDTLAQLMPLIKNSKNKTKEYYKKNPKSFSVVQPTDLIIDYLNDIINILKDEE